MAEKEREKSTMGRPTKYDPAYCEQVIELGKQGKSQVQIACALEVPRTTIRSWAEKHPDFSSALIRAKEEEQNWWENAGQMSLTADRFNAAVWSKSMSARFKEDYTETRKHMGDMDNPVAITDTTDRDRAKALLALLKNAADNSSSD